MKFAQCNFCNWLADQSWTVLWNWLADASQIAIEITSSMVQGLPLLLMTEWLSD
jgi:hypothetical protein